MHPLLFIADSMKHVCILLLSCANANFLCSKNIFFDAICRQAYADITSLKIKSGQALVNAAKNKIPIESYT